MYDTVCQFGQGGCDRSGVRDSGMPSDAVRGCTVLLVQRDQMPSSVPAAWGNEDNVARLILSDPDGPCPCEAFYSGKGQGAAHPGLCALSSRTPPAAAGAILSYQMVAGTPGTQLPHCSPGCTLCPVAPSCPAHLAGTICNKRGKGKKKKNLIRVPFVGWNPHQSHLPLPPRPLSRSLISRGTIQRPVVVFVQTSSMPDTSIPPWDREAGGPRWAERRHISGQ